jgi:Na+-transporting NADH:ubiquinone oxidoreductase subunit NqrB
MDRLKRLIADPRRAQIGVLACLLVYGTVFRNFVLTPLAIPLALGTALLVEHLIFRFRREGRPRPPYESALISGLSSLLLFRSTEPWAYVAVAGFAVASKVIFQFEGRHFINPTNGAVILGSLFLPGWITPGQWGHDVVFAFALMAGASLTLTRAGRLDTAIAFLGSVLFFHAVRHFVFGYRWATTGHLLESGALWLFALYMITDPRTTPQDRRLRYLHAFMVAGFAISLAQFWYVRDSFLWSLFLLAPLVPLADRLTVGATNPPNKADGGLDVRTFAPTS